MMMPRARELSPWIMIMMIMIIDSLIYSLIDSLIH